MKNREELLRNVGQERFYFERDSLGEHPILEKRYILNRQELQQILSAPTKAQMECPYCHGGREAKPVIETSSDFLAFDKNGTLAFGNDGSVEIFAGFTKLRYCPICGRKLGDE